MRDHDDSQTEQVAQFAHQPVNAGGAVRIKTRGRFIEKQQFRIECQRAGEGGALHHAAAQFGWILSGNLRLQAGQGDFPVRQFIDQRIVQPAVLPQRQPHIFLDRERTEQAAMLEHHPPALAQREGCFIRQFMKVNAEHPDRARVGALQQDHFAQQSGFAGAAAADQCEYFRAAYFEIKL